MSTYLVKLIRFLTTLTTAVFWLAGCNPLADSSYRNVVLISVDTLRADHVGCYGYQPPTTPAVDRLAAEGVVFEQAYASSPWTLPSHASIFTGLYPRGHGADLVNKSLPLGAVTLAEVLKDSGYRTGGVVCAPFLDTMYNFQQGFDVYDTELIDGLDDPNASTAGEVTRRGLQYLRSLKKGPFFLFLHYWDPHHPYNPAKKYVDLFDPDYSGTVDGFNIRERTDMVPGMDPRDLRHIVALYDGEIRATDEAIGAFLAELDQMGLRENTLVVLTSDHGEEFLEHGGRAHLVQCWQETIHVPLIMRIPWLKSKASRFAPPVSLVDLPNTILELVAAKKSLPENNGISLASAIVKGEALPDRRLLAETRMGQPQGREQTRGNWTVSIAADQLKYHHFVNPTEKFTALYDLRRDPREQDDLSAAQTQATERMEREIAQTNVRLNDLRRRLKTENQVKMNDQLSKRLRSLGYVN
ncbi:MAG: sulfatase [Myxococcales bacterium]|nr:sulfatase [Myxococcales bacterium]